MIEKILIVDDSPVARMMLKSCILKNKKYEIHEAGDGQEGIEKFETICPDLTFMDLTMPVLDGYQAIEGIKKKFNDALIVVISADIQKKAAERVNSMGVFEILQKPPKPKIIKETLLKAANYKAPFPAKEIFSEMEKNILQEVMNIAFGNAAADLAEVIDIYLELSTPHIHIINIGDMPEYLKEKIQIDEVSSAIITQNFHGDFRGFGILILPNNAGKSLLKVLQETQSDEIDDKPMAGQEKEVLLEIGNILIGACVGKVCELLKTFVTYNPPRIINEKAGEYKSFIDSFDPSQSAILMETLFRFNQVDIKGQFLIITNQQAMKWLKYALHDFLDPYK